VLVSQTGISQIGKGKIVDEKIKIVDKTDAKKYGYAFCLNTFYQK
jgi:hypothetical protein